MGGGVSRVYSWGNLEYDPAVFVGGQVLYVGDEGFTVDMDLSLGGGYFYGDALFLTFQTQCLG